MTPHLRRETDGAGAPFSDAPPVSVAPALACRYDRGIVIQGPGPCRRADTGTVS
jgi:hypothetical protein